MPTAIAPATMPFCTPGSISPGWSRRVMGNMHAMTNVMISPMPNHKPLTTSIMMRAQFLH